MKNSPTLCAIVAMTRKDWVMGKNNTLPWHAPEDLKYFKEVTMGAPVIMGRKTFDSIGRLLPKRWNIVLSSQPQPSSLKVDGLSWCGDWSKALSIAEEKARDSQKSEIFVIGGSQIFESTLQHIQRLYITWVEDDFEGDVVFPKIDLENKFKLSKEHKSAGPLSLSFCVYEKIV